MAGPSREHGEAILHSCAARAGPGESGQVLSAQPAEAAVFGAVASPNGEGPPHSGLTCASARFLDLLHSLHQVHVAELSALGAELSFFRMGDITKQKAPVQMQPAAPEQPAVLHVKESLETVAVHQRELEPCVKAEKKQACVTSPESQSDEESRVVCQGTEPASIEDAQTDPRFQSRFERAYTEDVLGRRSSKVRNGIYGDTARCEKMACEASKFKRKDSLLSCQDAIAGLRDEGSSHKALIYIVLHPYFEFFFAVIVFFQAFMLGVQSQCTGVATGGTLQFDNRSRPCSDAVRVFVFEISDTILLVIFSLEVVLKLIAHKSSYFHHKWHLVDLSIVFTDICTSELWQRLLPSMMQGDEDSMIANTSVLLRQFRVVKLLRLFKALKPAQAMDALFLITTALQGCATALVHTAIFLCMLQFGAAMLLGQVLEFFYFHDETKPLEQRLEVYQYFGTFSRACLSMFEVTLANWPPVCRLLTENVSEWFSPLFVLHKIVVGFAVVGVINGVFMQETFKAAASDDRIMVRQKRRAGQAFRKKMQRLFIKAAMIDEKTKSSEEIMRTALSMEEFRYIVDKAPVKLWLAAMGLEADNPDTLFNLIDNGDGALTLDELITGCAKLQGPARSMDLALVLKELKRLQAAEQARGEASVHQAKLVCNRMSTRLYEAPEENQVFNRMSSQLFEARPYQENQVFNSMSSQLSEATEECPMTPGVAPQNTCAYEKNRADDFRVLQETAMPPIMGVVPAPSSTGFQDLFGAQGNHRKKKSCVSL